MPASGAVLQLLINHLVSIRNHSRDSWLLSWWITRPSCSELWHPCFKVLWANITGLQFLGKSSGAYSFVVSCKFIGSWAILYLDWWGYNGRCEAIKTPSSWCKINSYPSIKQIWWIFWFSSLPNGKPQLYTHSHHAPSRMARTISSDCRQRIEPTAFHSHDDIKSRCTAFLSPRPWIASSWAVVCRTWEWCDAQSKGDWVRNVWKSTCAKWFHAHYSIVAQYHHHQRFAGLVGDWCRDSCIYHGVCSGGCSSVQGSRRFALLSHTACWPAEPWRLVPRFRILTLRLLYFKGIH